MPESNITPMTGRITRKPFHQRCWCGAVHGPLRPRDVPREPREDDAYLETGTDEWVPGPRDFEGEP